MLTSPPQELRIRIPTAPLRCRKGVISRSAGAVSINSKPESNFLAIASTYNDKGMGMMILTVEVNVNADYGALLLGGMLAFGLSGCVTMQFILYWQVYPDLERWTTKSLVMAIWLLDMCHSAFITVAVWDSVIADYGDLSTVDDIPWSVGPAVELTAMITFLVQTFFAHRVYKLQKNKLTVAGPVFILAFLRLVCASVTMVEMIKLKRYSVFGRPFPAWIFTLGLSLSALVDIIITTSLCYLLRSNRSTMESSSTNRIVDTLTVWTIENGSVTCFGAVTTLVCWLTIPNNRIFLGVHFVVAKLYANSFFATLNGRIKIHNSFQKGNARNQLRPIAILPENVFEERDEECGTSHPARRNSVDQYAPRPVSKKGSQPKLEVSISRTVETKYESGSSMDVPMTMISEFGREKRGLRYV